MSDEAYLHMVAGFLRGLSIGSDCLEADRETIGLLFSLALAWDGSFEVELSNLVVDALGKRIDGANRTLGKALLDDIPTRFGRGTTPADGMSAAKHDAILAAICTYKDTMDLLAELIDLPFVPGEIGERLHDQLGAIRRRSQQAMLGELERHGLPLTARVLRENPIC